MYIPRLFRHNNIEEVSEFIRANGFAILVNRTDGRLWATHIPLLHDKNEEGKDILHGHIAKANPQWKDFTHGEEVLVIFSGPHAYISSSWYDHENVPTWNYIAVHIYGRISISDEAKVLKSLSKLVDTYEAGSKNPVTVQGMSEEVLRDNLKGLVGFEIQVTEIHSARKLSQNRDDKNHEHIIEELKNTGDAMSVKIAEEMDRERPAK